MCRLQYTGTLQRHEAELTAEAAQVVALKQQCLDLEHAKESMALSEAVVSTTSMLLTSAN